MSQEVAIVAILEAAPGKLERIREFVTEMVDWIHANEPETLEFSVWEDKSGDGGVNIFMYERYASQAAVDKHESSDHYKEVFRTMTEEQLIAGTPVIKKGGSVYAFRR